MMWEGSFAGFAAHIQKSKFYVGYDSAGGHVAAACGVPLDQHLHRLRLRTHVPALAAHRAGPNQNNPA